MYFQRAAARRAPQRSAAALSSRYLSVLALPLCLATTLLCSAFARADSTLTLELPPSADAIAQKAADSARKAADRIPEAPQTSPGVMRPHRSPANNRPNRSSYASRGQSGGGERVVGRLGQVQQSTSIYRSQSSRSPRLSSVPTGTYLAIQSDGGNWYGILMSDGTLGWIHKQSIKVMDYQVVANGALTQSQPSGAVGDYSDGLPASRAAFFQGDPQALFREAYKYLGVPYHWGGNTSAGIDCSAFVKNVFEACGYALPRHSSDQTAYGLAVPKDQLQAGDRLYFGNAASRNITHTGLYLGNGYFIHASSNSRGVAISQLAESLYERMYICARR